MPKLKRLCRLCKVPYQGRADKIFCSLACKNEYHVRLRRATARVAVYTDRILHRNRSILLELLGKDQVEMIVPRLVLDRKKFNFHYYTSTSTEENGTIFFLIYDFAWQEGPEGEVVIRRRTNAPQ
jgi:hypothetical protein